MTISRPDHTRVLIYSHDSFGLGHLRRCRAIAHALVERRKNMSVLILSGSPIIGSFDFRARVDFVRIPGVIKLRDGQYTSLNLHIDIDEMLALRTSIIAHTAEIFDPDLFIVDKEPLGLRGEVRPTLELLKGRGVPLALGLRDVMDEPSLLVPEWERKNVLPALEDLYDEVWVYGLPQVCDPLSDIDLPQTVRDKIVFTGYLKRTLPTGTARTTPLPQRPFLLVTTGGGGDGEALVDWVMRAYETDPTLPYDAVMVLGPFMRTELQAEFTARAEAIERIEVTTFETRLEALMQAAVGVVAMGGYNTFCEILSFDKRAIIVPRMAPRLEQYIRASRVRDLGLVQMLADERGRPAEAMAAMLHQLPHQQLPSEALLPGLLDGLEVVDELAGRLIDRRSRPPISLMAGGL